MLHTRAEIAGTGTARTRRWRGWLLQGWARLGATGRDALPEHAADRADQIAAVVAHGLRNSQATIPRRVRVDGVVHPDQAVGSAVLRADEGAVARAVLRVEVEDADARDRIEATAAVRAVDAGRYGRLLRGAEAGEHRQKEPHHRRPHRHHEAVTVRSSAGGARRVPTCGRVARLKAQKLQE
jgi:hypothetical protein